MDDEALFDDDLTALPAEAVAACAAAFAMVAADAAAEEERDLGIALREPEVDIWNARLSGQRVIVAL